MWVSKKRNDKKSMICLKPKPSQSFFVNPIESKEKIFYKKKKNFFTKKRKIF